MAHHNGHCDCKNGNWSAVRDEMPRIPPHPQPHPVNVNGTVRVLTTGYTVSLHPAHEHGAKTFRLELRCEPPTGIAGDIVTDVPVHYRIESDLPLEHVEIVNCEPPVTMKITNML